MDLQKLYFKFWCLKTSIKLVLLQNIQYVAGFNIYQKLQKFPKSYCRKAAKTGHLPYRKPRHYNIFFAIVAKMVKFHAYFTTNSQESFPIQRQIPDKTKHSLCLHFCMALQKKLIHTPHEKDLGIQYSQLDESRT